MIDVVPVLVDGAIVFNFCYDSYALEDEPEVSFVHVFHNWLKKLSLEYVIFDFQEEKYIKDDFLQELIQLRKRLKIHFLFAGVSEEAKSLLESYNCTEYFPFFLTPEDAVRALRIQYPGMTESPIHSSIAFGMPLRAQWEGEGHGGLKRIPKPDELKSPLHIG